jgi:hypothetical protein
MFARIHPYVSEALEAELDRRAFDVIREHVRVVPSMIGVGSPLRGAGEDAWDRILTDPVGSARQRVGLPA